VKPIYKTGLVVFLALCFLWPACSKGEKNSAQETNVQKEISAGAQALLLHYDNLQKSVQNGDFPQAISQVESIKEELWGKIPLTLNNVLFVKGPDNSYGVYAPEEDDVYASGETIYLYLEPAGYQFKKTPSGQYEFHFVADFQLADEKGEILGGQEKFADLPFTSWHPNKEMSLTFNYHFTGLPAGKYKLITTVHDLNSGQKAATEKWFSVS